MHRAGGWCEVGRLHKSRPGMHIRLLYSVHTIVLRDRRAAVAHYRRISKEKNQTTVFAMHYRLFLHSHVYPRARCLRLALSAIAVLVQTERWVKVCK